MKRFLLTPIFKGFKRRSFFSSLEQNNCPVYDAKDKKSKHKKKLLESYIRKISTEILKSYLTI